MQEKVIFQNSKGDNLAGVLSDPGQGKFIFILTHGFHSNKDRRTYVGLEELFNRLGIASFRYDTWGCGQSEGKFEDITATEAIDDLEKAVELMKQRGYKMIGLLGSSFGGLIALIVAARYPELAALILRAPVVSFKEKIEQGFIRSYVDFDKLEERGFCYYQGKPGERKKLSKSFFDDVVKYNGYEAAENIKAPTLLIHGDKDDSVPYEQSVKATRLLERGKLITIKGADHFFPEPKHTDEINKSINEFASNLIIES